ncbi:MAG: hypothetical protein HY774_27160 [Acidobacteria bacterium]|nr:hypothetical protein [Acidobacteriota bacterium]
MEFILTQQAKFSVDIEVLKEMVGRVTEKQEKTQDQLVSITQTLSTVTRSLNTLTERVSSVEDQLSHFAKMQEQWQSELKDKFAVLTMLTIDHAQRLARLEHPPA